MANEIDPATVRRCIEVLRGKGEHEYRRVPYRRDREECWTYTTHPTDLLQALLPEPEKSEAEKLVDEWHGLQPADSYDSYDANDHVSLVQFVLDKVNAPNPAEVLRDIATDIAEEHGYTVDHQSFDAASEYCATADSQPQYVFGPWVEWHGGKCPVPDDWMVETVFGDESLEHHEDTVIVAEDWDWNHELGSLSRYNITHYRVRFEVGKWYDWAGGACPVLPEQKINIGDKWAGGGEERASGVMWNHIGTADITSFRCVE